MCGFALLSDPRLPLPVRSARVATSVVQLGHRGPDAAGALDCGGASFGHTRLAIVDLVGGRQPMQDPSQRWTLVFNGEIYNYRSLREKLAGEWQFRDASDTEVLLAGLVLRGERFVAELDGMFAFALHDAERGKLLLARDGFGKKPLYYRGDAGAFACASELPALRALMPDAPWQENAAGIGDFFRYGYTMPGMTCIDDVREVLPGHVMHRDADGTITTERYWTPTIEPWQGSFDDAAEQVRELLLNAVRKRQLASDVEVGAFLSGGVDSTIVCALAQQTQVGRRLRTFTAGFNEASYDERVHAARAATMLDTLHTEGELLPEQAMELADDFTHRLGQPFGDASLVPTAMVSRLAARDVKVVLSGDGGDEVFGGYTRYTGRLLMQRYRRAPAFARKAFESLVSMTPEPLSHHSGSVLKKAHLFVGLARDAGAAYVAPPVMRADAFAMLVPGLSPGHAVPESPWPQDLDELRQMLLQDWLVWLPQDILAKVDRASMRFSLEVRSPFLDRDLAEFVLRLPWQWHFSGLRGKRLLHAAMRGHAPDFIWRRRKQGFASPVGHWMRDRLGDRLLAMSHAADTGVIDGAGLRRLLDQHRTGGRDHSQSLWLAYAYLNWCAGSR